MKKYLLLLLSAITYGQTYQNPTYGTITTKTNTESATANRISVQETSGLINWLQPINIPIPTTPSNYVPTAPTLGGHLDGINNKLGSLSGTTAGISTRVWFTADQTTITAGTFDLTNPTSKGTAASHQQTVVNDDGQKKYFTTDLIGQPFAMITTFPAGTYAGNLTASTTPTNANQRFTVELYRCNNAGTPIASGVTGAVVGDLGVTVIMIMDSGEVTLANASITNVAVATVLGAGGFSIAVGERIRYHVSAAKAGTAGGVINESVYYGSSYNSFIDVPVIYNSSSIKDVSTVTNGSGNVTDALNSLQTGKVSIAGAPETITSQKTFNPTVSASGAIGRGTYFTPTLSAIANNDAIIGVDISPVFTVGAFTNVAAYPLRASSINGTADILVGRAGNGGKIDFGRPTDGNPQGHIGYAFGSNDFGFYAAGGSAAVVFDARNNLGHVDFRIDSSNRMEIFPTGNILIQNGGTYTDNATDRLQVTGTVLSTGYKVADNPLGTSTNKITQTMASDYWSIYGKATVADRGEMVFELGDNAIPYDSDGERFRFHYEAFSGGGPLAGISKDPFIIDYNQITVNGNAVIQSPNGFMQVLNELGNGVRLASASGSNSFTNGTVQGDAVLIAKQRLFVVGGDSGTIGTVFNTDGTVSFGSLAGPSDSAIGVDASGKLKRIAASGSYLSYTALLTQTGTGAPTATVLENTLGGTVVWSYVSTGIYQASLTGAFTNNKTVVFLNRQSSGSFAVFAYGQGDTSGNSVTVSTQTSGGGINGELAKASIEIRVYN